MSSGISEEYSPEPLMWPSELKPRSSSRKGPKQRCVFYLLLHDPWARGCGARTRVRAN